MKVIDIKEHPDGSATIEMEFEESQLNQLEETARKKGISVKELIKRILFDCNNGDDKHDR